MVPHRRFLQAVSLVLLVRTDGPAVCRALCEEYAARPPGPLGEFAQLDVLPYLPAALEAAFLTTDAGTTSDYRPFFAAAETLGLASFVSVGPAGPTVALPAPLARWRQDNTLRMFIETCMLCGVSDTQIGDDLKRLYGMDPDEASLGLFRALFVDAEYAAGDGWLTYVRCIGDAEGTFKRRLMGQPSDFVRWKLGVPVQLDTEKVLDRMVSDAYYTERLIKMDAGENGLHLGKDEVARVKLERDTIFKAMDRKQKLRESAGGTQADAALRAIGQLVAGYESQDGLPLLTELDSAPQP